MRQNEDVVNDFFSSIIFCRHHEILLCITKVVNEKLIKTYRQQKKNNLFLLFKRANASIRFMSVNSKRYHPPSRNPRANF